MSDILVPIFVTLVLPILLLVLIVTMTRRVQRQSLSADELEAGPDQLFQRADTLAVFEQPQNGFRENVPRRAWLYMMLFGIFYLMVRQLWMHVAIVAAVILVTVSVSPWLLVLVGLPAWAFYVANAGKLIIANYYRRGWKPVALEAATVMPEIPDGSL